MKIDAHVIITTATPRIEVMAHSNSAAGVMCCAPSFRAGLRMLQESVDAIEKQAEEATTGWKPDPLPMEAEPDEKEKRRAARFKRGTGQAHEFLTKHDHTGGFRFTEIKYLMRENIFDAISDAYALAYRRGYNAAKKAAKK